MNGYCKVPDCNRPTEGTTKLCATHNRALRKIVKSPIKRVADKFAKKMDAYGEKRRIFLHGKRCAVYPHLPATDVHHMRGRIGDLLLDERYWLPVSRKGHVEIEMNPAWAKKMGYSLSRTTTQIV